MIKTLKYLWYLVKTTLVNSTPCIITGKVVSISVKWSVRKQLSTPLTRCGHQTPYRVACLVHHNYTGYSKISSFKLNYWKPVRLDVIRLTNIWRTRWYHNLWFLISTIYLEKFVVGIVISSCILILQMTS